MNWVEQQYIGRIASRLDRFTRKNSGYNFRCPLCGDSKKSKTKSRGWFYSKDNKTWFHCHNCGVHMSFSRFLEQFDRNEYTAYRLDLFNDLSGGQKKRVEIELPKVRAPLPGWTQGPFGKLRSILNLKDGHPAKVMMEDRKIPVEWQARLLYCSRFYGFTNQLVPEKFSEAAVARDEPRMIIPFLNKEQKVHAYQGRSFDPDSQNKYITIVLDETTPKVFGLDRLDTDSTVYVLEGPIDAMFIENSIATGGGDLSSAIGSMEMADSIIVYDNERRSPTTIKKMKKAVDLGHRVLFWPENVVQNDVNDMIVAGIEPSSIKWMFDTFSYSGLRAKLELSKWRKI